MLRNASRWCCWFVLAGLCLAGCSGQPEPLSAVHGLVTYRERPLSSGTIVFVPDSARGNSGQLVQADIQHDGSYFLRTGDRPGAAPGKYRITVRSLADNPSQPNRILLLTPERYSDPKLSGLTCEVKPDEDNTINFHLR